MSPGVLGHRRAHLLVTTPYVAPPAGVTDNFTGGDGTAIHGRVPTTGAGTWVKTGGGAVISGNKAKISAYDPAVCVIDSGLSDGTVQVVVNLAPGTRGLRFRQVDASNYWHVDFTSASSDVWLAKVVAGSETTNIIGSATAGSNPHTLKVVLAGNSISVFDGATQIGSTVTDSTHASATTHGFQTVGFFEPDVLFDDFSVA